MDTQVIILAAGRGTRMSDTVPKVLMPVLGRPMLEWVYDAVCEAVPYSRPMVVVGHARDQVRRCLGSKVRYVVRADSRGTGDAVAVCRKSLIGKYKQVVVVYGDHPTLHSSVLRDLITQQKRTGARVVISTVKVPDFRGRRAPFLRYGHLVRDQSGKKILRCVEYKDATRQDRSIKEVNSGYYCFDAEWLWKNIGRLNNNNAKHEYYLTDLIGLAVEDGHTVIPVPVRDWRYGLGANTPTELKVAESLLRETWHT